MESINTNPELVPYPALENEENWSIVLRRLEKKLLSKIQNESQQKENEMNSNIRSKKFRQFGNQKHPPLSHQHSVVHPESTITSQQNIQLQENNKPLSFLNLSSISPPPLLRPSNPLSFESLIGLNHEISGISHISAPKLLNLKYPIELTPLDSTHFPVEEVEPPVIIHRLNRYGGYVSPELDDNNRNSVGLCNEQFISDDNQNNSFDFFVQEETDIHQNFINESGYNSHGTISAENTIEDDKSLPNSLLTSPHRIESVINADKKFENIHEELQIQASNIAETDYLLKNIQMKEIIHVPDEVITKQIPVDVQVIKQVPKYEAIIYTKSKTTQKNPNQENLTQLTTSKSSLNQLKTNSKSEENVLKIFQEKKPKNKIGPKILKIFGFPLSNNANIPPVKPKRQIKHRRSLQSQIQPKSLQSLNITETEPYDSEIVPWWYSENNASNETKHKIVFKRPSISSAKSEPYFYRSTTLLNNEEVIEFLRRRVKETKYVTAVFESANNGLAPVLIDIEQEFRHWLGPKSHLLAVACEVHWSVPERFRSRVVEIKYFLKTI